MHYLLLSKVDPEGGTLAVGFSDGVVRFLKLVPSNNSQQQFDLVLVEAFKPHTKPIRSISVDSKSSILATGVSLKYILFLQTTKSLIHVFFVLFQSE